MKILWLSHFIPYPPKGGALQRSFNLVREVSKSNTVCLVAFSHKSLLPPGLRVGDAVSALRQYCAGIEVIPLPSDKNPFSKYFLALKSLFTTKPYTVNWNRSPDMKGKVVKAIDSFHPDLIHYDTIGMAEYFQYRSAIPQVLNHHNIESAMMLRRAKREKNLIRKLYFLLEATKIRAYESNVCGLFHCNLAVSREDASTLKRIVPEADIAVIPNGVDTSYFSPQLGALENETLVFAGGMRWYPNKDAMLFFTDEVWPLLKRKRPTIRMIVIGGSPPKRLQRVSQRDPHFRLTGYVDDVRPYFNKASVYVCPIRDGGGTRLKILDALSFGLPIVATTTAAEGIRVTPQKNIIIADTPEDIAANILCLIEDQAMRKRLSIEGRMLAEELYAWPKIGARLNNLYSSLAS